MLPPPETTLSHQLHTLQRAEGEEMPGFVISSILQIYRHSVVAFEATGKKIIKQGQIGAHTARGATLKNEGGLGGFAGSVCPHRELEGPQQKTQAVGKLPRRSCHPSQPWGPLETGQE